MLHRGCVGIMEKDMDTIILGLGSRVRGLGSN